MLKWFRPLRAGLGAPNKENLLNFYNQILGQVHASTNGGAAAATAVSAGI